MDRLPEHLVAWHNRHPLAKRITIYDVHTVGVVALPFMRSGRAAGPGDAPELIEPVMGEPVLPNEEEAAWAGDSALAEPNTNAAHLDALADQEPPPPTAETMSPPRWQFWRRGAAAANSWPVFSERFIEGLSLRRIAALAQAHGYSQRPGDASWPLRDIGIDDRLIAKVGAAGGAWPVEIYLISAAIDAGRSRSRVLIGRKGVSKTSPPIVGKRCLSPIRVGAAAVGVLVLAGAVVAALWRPPVEGAADVPVPPVAASSASASAAAPASALAAAPAASTASAAASMPDAPPSETAVEAALTSASPAAPASEPAAEPASAPEHAASEPPPDIRPKLVQRNYPPRAKQPTRSMLSAPEDKPIEKAASTPVSAPATVSPTTPARTPPASTGTKAPTTVVALVGPPSANKAEAEAMLERLRTAVAGTQGKTRVMQGQVFQTPEGYRAAVWPFASREEAQLINAVLVARGLKTRAVDF